MTFDDFDIDPRCLRVLHEQNISEPTPIQEGAIPIALSGKDIIGVAQTGTGKTLGYALPAVTRLAAGPPKHNMMLVLVPTRELALQVGSVFESLGKATHLRTAILYGGVGYDKQRSDLKKGSAVIVATPGRLLDHMSQGAIRWNDLMILCMDEADRMLDMGFLPDIRRVLRKLPEDRQTMMFSATFPDEIARLTGQMMNDPERVTVGAISKPVDSVRQVIYGVRHEDKSRLLLHILDEEDVQSAMIFLRTKERTERIGQMLRRKGYKAGLIHGDRSQKQREQALKGFREGKYRFLVATDVAARGLDIDGVSHVFNYDVPPNPDDYIHRVGRTARAQADGDAVTFVSPNEYGPLETIERALGRNLPRGEWEDSVDVMSLFQPRVKGVKRTARRRAPRRLLRRR
jgi:ATP-dependent RNA helicase RhlE